MINSRSFLWTPAALLVLLIAQQTPTRADFTPIAQPNTAYTSSTTLVDLASITDGTTVNSLVSGTETISLSTNLTKWTVPVPLGYSFWGSPPFTESSTPPVLQSGTSLTSLTLSFGLAVNTFGLELQGNPAVPALSSFTMNFYDNATLVGSVTQSVNSNQTATDPGARLFAATSLSNAFTQVVITAPLAASGFGIAQLRFGTASVVPEPASIAMMAQAIGVAGFVVWRKRRK